MSILEVKHGYPKEPKKVLAKDFQPQHLYALNINKKVIYMGIQPITKSDGKVIVGVGLSDDPDYVDRADQSDFIEVDGELFISN